MTVLSLNQVLQEKKATDPNSITSLSLTHKNLSDVSCLSQFKNLEKLDLAFNSLTSLEDLKECVNLKWLSVVQNKLQSLKGIEALTNLTIPALSVVYAQLKREPFTSVSSICWSLVPGNQNTDNGPKKGHVKHNVLIGLVLFLLKELILFRLKKDEFMEVLNAGKNKLRSMDEVKSVVSLRALILNDNEIVSLCILDQMKELNTLVLSRNPIRKIGESLASTKSLSKLSLSNCQLQTIDSSLKSCIALKELRLGHNEIKILPNELARNVNIQNLDLGNNSIVRWSDVKVLPSLVNLRNLNLQGNPIAEKEKPIKKIKKLLPNLQILNARPVDKVIKNDKGVRARGDSSFLADRDEVVQKEDQADHSKGNKVSKHKLFTEDPEDVDRENEHKLMKEERNEPSDHKVDNTVKKSKAKKEKKTKEEDQNNYIDPDLQKGLIPEKRKLKELTGKGNSDQKGDGAKKAKQDFDDIETPFEELFSVDNIENGNKSIEKKDVDMVSGLVSYPKKNKKAKSTVLGSTALKLLTPAPEIGFGGPSAWDE